MRKYELMMIVNPALPADETTTFLAQVEKDLEETTAKIVSVDDMGVKDLAYKINSSLTGHYVLYTLETTDGVSFFDVTNSFNIRKDIWRFMFTRLED